MDNKRKKSNWVIALQLWNKKHKGMGCFLMPKKGTAEYSEVKNIQSKLDQRTPPAPKKAPVNKAPKQNIKFKKAPAPAEKEPFNLFYLAPVYQALYKKAVRLVNKQLKKNKSLFSNEEIEQLYMEAFERLKKEDKEKEQKKKAPKRNIQMKVAPAPAPAPKKQNIKFKKKEPSFKYTKEEATKAILKTTNKLGTKKKKELNDFFSKYGIHRLFYVSPDTNYKFIHNNLPINVSEKMTEQIKDIWKNSPLNDEAKHHSYSWRYADVGATPNQLSTDKQLRRDFPFKSEYVNASRENLILENRFRDQKKYFERRDKLKTTNLNKNSKFNTKTFDKQTDKGLDKINDKYGLKDKFRYSGHIKQTLKREYKPIIDDKKVNVMGADDDIYATQRKQAKKYKYDQYGRGLAEVALSNPDETFKLGQVVFGTPNAPRVKNGKVEIPKDPLTELFDMIF